MQALQSTKRIILSIFMMLLVSFAVIAIGEPTPPMSLERGDSSSFNMANYNLQQTDALAGNITWLTLTGISQTRSWQGFWGNVSGYITLDDANNFTFYNWSAAEPRGYVYASLVSHGTPSWVNVVCFNHEFNASVFDTYYNISQDDYDNVTQTYNTTLPLAIYVVNNTFSDCPSNAIWRDDNYQGEDFINYLMWDSTLEGDDSWVFGTIIENKDLSTKEDITCYNGQYCDFQLLVAENGHGTDVAVTPYYIWVDLTS